MKSDFKEKAIALRKNGRTYSEILKEVPVAKSTLSLWLREVGLSKSQKQRLTKKKREGALKGAQVRKDQRLLSTQKIHAIAQKEIGKISSRELWLIGVALYWAEGAKEKEYRIGAQVDFCNTDSRMIKLYLKWLLDACHVRKEDIYFHIYIHENKRKEIDKVYEYWRACTKFPKDTICYVYFKKHNPKTVRKNIGESYNGVLTVRVKKSVNLNRKIAGWVKGICLEFN